MMGRGRIEAATEGLASDLEAFRGRKESWHEPWLFLYACSQSEMQEQMENHSAVLEYTHIKYIVLRVNYELKGHQL